MIKATCPTCGGELAKVERPAHWNADQWDSMKAGDWVCLRCPGNGRGQSGLCYWLDEEVKNAKRHESK